MKKIILLIIVLMILPIYSFIVMADISGAVAHGNIVPEVMSCLKGNSYGYVDDAERLVVEVAASISGDSQITKDQLIINDVVSFGENEDCEQFICSSQLIDLEGISASDIANYVSPLRVKLYTDEPRTLVSEVRVPIAVDYTGPTISEFHIIHQGTYVENYIIGPGEITLVYEIEDDCAGIKEARLYVDGSPKGEPHSVNGNRVEETIDVASIAPSGGWPDSPVNICVKAWDLFEQRSESCLRLTVDDDVPVIDSNSLVILSNGQSQRPFVTSGRGNVNIGVNVRDISQSVSISANFNGLGYDNTIQGQCSGSGTFYCTWSNIPISIQQGNSVSIEFTGNDALGNTMQLVSVPVSITVDNSPPQATFSTRYELSVQKYVKERNQFTATITDDTGVNTNSVSLDLSTLGAGGTVHPNECTKVETGNVWNCKWNNIVLGAIAQQNSIKTIYLYVEDAVGNRATTYPYEMTVKVDRNLPELQDISNEKTDDDWLSADNYIIITPSYNPYIEGSVIYIVGTSTLTITALVKDDTEVQAFADLTGLVDNAIPYLDAGESDWEPCIQETREEEEETFWRCIIAVPEIKKLNEDKTIKLYFNDSIGNQKIEYVPLKIKTTGIELLPEIEISSNEYEETDGKIIGTSTLEIKAWMASPINPSPEITASVTFPEEIGIKKTGDRTDILADNNCRDTETVSNVEKVLCKWNTANWVTNNAQSGAVPREGSYTLSFKFVDELGNSIISQPTITVIEPRALELMQNGIGWEQTDLNDVFPPNGIPPPHFKGTIVAERGITFTANVTHPGYSEQNEHEASIAEAYADFSDLLEPTSDNNWNNVAADSCTFVSGQPTTEETPRVPAHWKCVWSLAGAVVKEKTGINPKSSVRFRFKDIAGNSWPATNVDPLVSSTWYKEEYKIIGLKDITDQKYWKMKVNGVTVFPEVVDRQTASLLSQRVEARVELEPDGPCKSTKCEILSIANSCRGDTVYVDGGIKIKNTYTQSPWLYFNLKAQDYPIDQIGFNCTLQIRFKENDYIYTAPAEVNVTNNRDSRFGEAGFLIKFYDYPLGEVSQNVRNKIENTMEGGITKNKMIGDASDVLGKLLKVCRVIQSIEEVNKVLAGVETVTAPLQAIPLVRPVAKAAHEASKNTDNFVTRFTKKTYKICQYVMCDKTLWDKYVFGDEGYIKYIQENQLGNNVKILEELESIGTEQNVQSATFFPRDPSESIVLSAATGCLPGVIFNLQKARNIECSYALCLYENARQGMSTAPCEAEKSFGYCKYYYGQIFELVPYKEFFEWVYQGASQVFNDPLSTTIGILEWECRMKEENIVHGVCVLKNAGKVLNAIGALKRLDMSIRVQPPQDVCEEAKRIIQWGTPEPGAEGAEPPTIPG